MQKRDSPKGDEIFDILHRGHARASMLSCSLNPDPGVVEAKTRAGLVRGHAYSITKVWASSFIFHQWYPTGLVQICSIHGCQFQMWF